LPRPIIQWLTGTVTTKAMARAAARVHQNSALLSVAAIAPGTSTRNALSTTSMVRIETVSAASAVPTAAPTPSPARRTDVKVSR
jgi:hypothetical protein